MEKFFLSLCAATFALAACSERDNFTEILNNNGKNGAVASTEEATSINDYCTFPTAAPAPGANQTAFDQYSWAMFLSLNWVVSSTERGVPNCNQPFTAPGLRVWESWKTTDQVFLPGATNPGTWNAGWNGNSSIALSATSKLTPDAAKALQATPSESGVLQPVGGWLIDQRGNPTYYQVASNEISYNYIVTNQLYNANIAQAFHPVDFPFQSAEIKASWRILTSQDDSSRYLTTVANVEQFDASGNPTGTFVTKTLGLVGLHIINKAPNFPQWVWATFEQIDNVTPTAPFASYYDAAATNPNQSPCYQNASPCQPKPGASFTTPDPLTRQTPISAETAAVNAAFQAMIPGGFGRYYQLVTTQRPNSPNDPGNPLGTPTPNIAANVTLESYIQPTSSCMACHQTAAAVGSLYKSDFSFLLLHAQAPTTAFNWADVPTSHAQ